MNIIRTLHQLLASARQTDAHAAHAEHHHAGDVDIYEFARRLDALARTRMALYAAAGVGR